MKRIPGLALFAVLVLVMTACGTTFQNPTLSPQIDQYDAINRPTYTAPMETEPPATTAATPTEATVPPTTIFVPEIYPDVVGLYIPAEDGTRGRKPVKEFASNRTAKKDIDCFEVFASTESYVTGNSFSSMWQTAWDVFEDTQQSKIGFHIQFDLSDGTVIEQTILKPGDAKGFYEYLEIYLYDDINQTPGVRYTHLEDKEIDDETIISSIKLTSGSKIEQVGDIVLTAFIYNGEDCFDADSNYIGTVSTSVIITE